jgi:hypothetical protein
MPKTLFAVRFKKPFQLEVTYTSRLSQVHINPHERPVMLTSPKRRCQTLTLYDVMAVKTHTFNTCSLPARASSYLSRSKSPAIFDSDTERWPLKWSTSSSSVCSSTAFSMMHVEGDAVFFVQNSGLRAKRGHCLRLRYGSWASTRADVQIGTEEDTWRRGRGTVHMQCKSILISLEVT